MEGAIESILGSDVDEPLLRPAARPLEKRQVRFSNPPPRPSSSISTASNGHRHMFDSKKFDRLTVEQFQPHKMGMYYKDIFHTLINMPSYRFLLLFLFSYVSMYIVYALLYMSQPKHCISLVQNFTHALWFSVQTSATIGYGHQAPDPDCFMLNVTIMGQVLTTALMQAALLGLVYARFSAPSSRSATIKFSSILAMYREADGLYRLAFRVANMRKHQVLQPEVRMLMMRKEAVGEGGALEYRYHELPLMHVGGGARLWLGVPSIMAHRVDASSPLRGMGRSELEECDCEFVVLMDGIDESTSTAMQARHSYFASDIRWGRSFAGVLARQASGALRADYSHFDLTRLAGGGGSDDEELGGAPGGDEASAGGIGSGVPGEAPATMPQSPFMAAAGRPAGHGAAVGAMC